MAKIRIKKRYGFETYKTMPCICKIYIELPFENKKYLPSGVIEVKEFLLEKLLVKWGCNYEDYKNGHRETYIKLCASDWKTLNKKVKDLTETILQDLEYISTVYK
jgi:hypothetical protein